MRDLPMVCLQYIHYLASNNIGFPVTICGWRYVDYLSFAIKNFNPRQTYYRRKTFTKYGVMEFFVFFYK
jgi:hypothetical protein